MSGQLSWRYAVRGDAAELAAMNLCLIRDEGHRNPMGLVELEQRMAGWISSGDYRAVKFEAQGEVVGYALFHENGDEEIYLRQFFIREGCRRRGHGRAAMALLRTQVFPDGRRVVLEVLCGNMSGQQFWKALGFKDYAVTMELQE